MKLEPKTLWLAAAIALTLFVFWLGPRWGPEGFQGRRASAGEGTLFPVAPFAPRKDPSHGASFKGVPLVIYHSWGTSTVPPRMYKHIQALIEQNPEFDYSFNTDDDCRRFIAEHFDSDVVRAFDCLRPGAYKSDLWRYCVLYKKGGVYIDIKNRPEKKLLTFLDESDLPLFVRDSGPVHPFSCIWNGFMAAAPGNPVFKRCIDEIVRSVSEKEYGESSLHITGPCLIGRVVKELTPNYSFKFYNRNHVIYRSGGGEAVAREYDGYRGEQRAFQKTGHYSELYKRREVYSC
jgi:hypothetical protein